MMARSAPVPAFFQVLVGDFSVKLRIPRDFVNLLDGQPALCKLQGPDGKCWDVILEENENDLFFHRGWWKFVNDNFLVEKDFLVFNYDGNSCFNVTIYDESACEMVMEVSKRKRSGGGQRRDYDPPGESRIIEFKSVHFCFKRTMVKHMMYQLTIPIKIARAKLDMSKPTIIELQDPVNRSWPVTVSPMEDGRVLMLTRRRECSRMNQIEEGQTTVFEIVEGYVKLHIFRAEGCILILTGPNVVGRC